MFFHLTISCNFFVLDVIPVSHKKPCLPLGSYVGDAGSEPETSLHQQSACRASFFDTKYNFLYLSMSNPSFFISCCHNPLSMSNPSFSISCCHNPLSMSNPSFSISYCHNPLSMSNPSISISCCHNPLSCFHTLSEIVCRGSIFAEGNCIRADLYLSANLSVCWPCWALHTVLCALSQN